jgi:hypothetical protein
LTTTDQITALLLESGAKAAERGCNGAVKELRELMESQKEFLNSQRVIRIPNRPLAPVKMTRDEFKAYLMNIAITNGTSGNYCAIMEKEKDFFQVDDEINLYL